jgi:hypothetical protein
MLSHHPLRDTVLAAANPAPNVLVQDAKFPGVLAALGATVLILFVFRFMGKRIGWDAKFDDIGRVAIGFFGFAGILSFFPLVGVISDIIGVFYNSFAQGSGWGTAGKWGVGVVSFAAAGFGAYLYYRKASFGNLFLMALLCLPFFSVPWVRDVSLWWINHAAVPSWNGIVSAWNAMASLDISVSAG